MPGAFGGLSEGKERDILDAVRYRNDLEIWVYHLKRGGGHAVINWICCNFDREVYHLNNAFSKPLKARLRGPRIFRRITDPARHGGPGRRLFNVELGPDVDYRDVATMRKQVLVTNVENARLPRLAREPLWQGRAYRLIGRSRERRSVLVLRDAFNTFASVARGKRRMRARLMSFYRAEWKSYAREFLGETAYLPADTVKISFNAWFLDPAYRFAVAETLGLDHSERGVGDVGSDGGGSSFSGREFDRRAQDMKVLDRWRLLADDPVYLASLDRETVELSNAIFGDVTGGLIAPSGG